MVFQIDNLPFESELLEEIKSVCEVITLEGGNMLIKTDQYLKVIPFVLQGGIRVYHEDVDLGREVLLYYIDPGETCIMSLVASFKDMQSKVNAVTESNSVLLLIPTPKVREWQVKYNKWNDFIINIFLNRYAVLLNNLNDVTFRNIDERLLSYLKQYHQRQGEKIQLTHQNLANELGTTRVVISRLLKNMEKEGIVELKRGVIKLITK